MCWWIILGVCVVVGIIGVVIDHNHEYSSVGFATSAIAFTLAVLIGLFSVPLSIVSARDVNQFKEQKQYIENHTVKDPIENAALTTEKIKQNKWLYNVQWSVENCYGWTFYPDNVKDLKPIQ
jgi:hypothetical protein